MDHRIYELPLINFVARENRAIPIAPANESETVLAAAYDEIDRALAAGELVGIFPEGRLTSDGEIGPFKGGLRKILDRRSVPVIPMGLSGLWDSALSRQPGSKLIRLLRAFGRRIHLNVGPALAHTAQSPEAARQAVADLRGAAR